MRFLRDSAAVLALVVPTGAFGLRRDLALRRRLGEKAREKVLREATWDAVVSRILALAGGVP